MSTPQDFEPLPMATAQCPRCGIQQDLAVVARGDVVRPQVAVDYAVVCTTPTPTGGRCGTSLRLTAIAHVFTVASS